MEQDPNSQQPVIQSTVPQPIIPEPTNIPPKNEQVKKTHKHSILKSFGIVVLLVTLFVAGFGSALVLTGFPQTQNPTTTVTTPTNQEQTSTDNNKPSDETTQASTIPAGFKKVESEMCNFSALMPERSDYEEEKTKRSDYEWDISKNPSKVDSTFSLNFSQVIIGVGRVDGIGGDYIPGWVVVDCAPANGKDLREAYSALESDLANLNKGNNDQAMNFINTFQGYTTMWGEESIVYSTSGGYGNPVNWLVVKNDMVYRVQIDVDSNDRGIQDDTRAVFDSLKF